MVNHDCIQQEKLGAIEEFIKSMKSTRGVLWTIAIAIVLQVGSFLYLWGSLTTTVKKNTEYMWGTLSVQTTENTRNIDKILTKFEMVMLTKNAHAESVKQ
jgi:hypothetical protein